MKAMRGTLVISVAILSGCLAGRDDGAGSDVLPHPIGEKVIPLDSLGFQAGFHYVEYDTTGALVQRIDNLVLDVSRRRGDIYDYAFETPDRGLLLLWDDKGGNVDKRDSMGVYILGSYHDTVETLDSVPTLWVPQFPQKGRTWMNGNHFMEVVSADTAYYLEPVTWYTTQTQYGFHRYSTILIRETAGDTLTVTRFAKGIGCLSFERSVRGRLLVSGILATYDWFPPAYTL